MNPRPKLYVHCGLHKTASTTLQRTLLSCRDALAEQNLFVPRSGRLSNNLGAHHNIAFELAGHARFRRENGTLADLKAEIDGVEGDVLVSSEEFETLLGTEDGLAPLKELAEATDRTLIVVVYVREQISFFISFMTQVAKKEPYPTDHRAAMRDILETGRLFEPMGNIINFDYAAMVARVRRQGVSCLLRDYHRIKGAPLDDLMSALEREPIGPISGSGGRANVGVQSGMLTDFVRKRSGLADALPLRCLAAFEASLDIVPNLSPEAHDRFAARFEAGNAQLAASEAIDLNVQRAPSAELDALCFDRVFTQETQSRIVTVLERHFPPRHLRPGLRGIWDAARTRVRERTAGTGRADAVAADLRAELLPFWGRKGA